MKKITLIAFFGNLAFMGLIGSAAFSEEVLCFSTSAEEMIGKDLTENYSNCLQLANGGDANAQIKLGYMFTFNEGVPVNMSKVERSSERLKWFTAAAEQGNAEGQFLLGFTFDAEDYDFQLKWIRAAAVQGYGPAQEQLSKIYEEGKGVTPDLYLAYMWMRIAYESGYIDAGTDSVRLLSELAKSGADVKILDGLVRRCVASAYKECEK